MSGETIYCFEAFTLDLRRGSLRAADREIDLRPKSFEVLRYLVENAGRLVPKDELMQAIWPDVTVTDESLTRCVSDVRLALQDQAQQIIKTVPRRGYLFAASVSHPATAATASTPPPVAVPAAPDRADTPSTAAPISQGGPRTAERRQMTILTCELTGLVALSAELDLEDLREVTAACHRHCAEIIERHRGRIARFAGDAVIAYFGYAQAHEYDAERAVQAGLALVEALPKLRAASATPLAARVGIATGLVVLGDLDAAGSAPEQFVVGKTPNLAAGLQALAKPGTVVISSGTRSLTGGLFNYRDLGSLALKGLTESVQAWQVLGGSGAESRFEALRTPSTPLVGRSEEIDLLLRRWEQAKASEGSVVLLSGEPGIGKSRIAETVIDRLSGEPHHHVRYYCSPHHQDSALHPVIMQIERVAGLRRDDPDEQRLENLEAALAQANDDIGAAVPLLADLLSIPTGDRYPALTLTPNKRKEKTLRALVTSIEGLAARRPLLMLCEDIHWSDPTTLEFLDLIVDRVATLRALVIIVFRPEFTPPWVGRPQVTLLSLNRLPPRQRAEMITKITGGKSLPKEIADQIVDRTDGVPLFIEELTKAVVESGQLVDVGDRYIAAGPAGPLAIPTSLQESLLSRLDRLAPTRTVAQAAAALGRQFSHELISAVAAIPQEQLDDALAQLVGAGLIFRRGAPPDAEYTFKHSLVQDTAYGTMLRSQRVQLHARVAATLADRFPETREAEPELLAYHFTQGGAVAEAIPLWAAAGQRAASHEAHVEAVGHLQTALDLVRQQPADGARAGLELQLLIGLAVSLGASRGYAVPEVEKALAEARAICDTLGDVAELFAVQRGLCVFSIIAGDLAGAEETARRCAAIGEQTGLAEHHVESDAMLGYIMFAKGELPMARQHLERGVKLYVEHDGAKLPMVGPQDSLVFGLGSLLQVLHAMGDEAGATRIANELEAHSRSLRRPYDLAYGLSWVAFYELMRGSFARAQSVAEEALAMCRDHGFALYELVAANLRAHALGQQGQPDQALAVAQTAVPAFNSLGMMHFTGFYLGEVAALQAAAGDTPAALRTIEEAITAAERYDDRFFLSPLHYRRAQILARVPGTDRATVTVALSEAIAIAEAQGAAGFARQAATLLETVG